MEVAMAATILGPTPARVAHATTSTSQQLDGSAEGPKRGFRRFIRSQLHCSFKGRGLSEVSSTLRVERNRRSCSCRLSSRKRIVTWAAAETVTEIATPPNRDAFFDEEDYLKAGGSELQLVQMQAQKQMDQALKAAKLKPLVPGSPDPIDVVVVGCGPAGLSLAAAIAQQGLSVGLVGPDLPFVNNYGVWLDEFQALGLDGCIEQVWPDTAVYLRRDEPILVGRAYGRVSRTLLHDKLVRDCAAAGVRYFDGQVAGIEDLDAGADGDEGGSIVTVTGGKRFRCRLVTVAAGAAAGRFLAYDNAGAGVGVQTAYGIEVEVESYPFDLSVMHFMDYRSWKGMTSKEDGHEEPAAFRDVPTFLYAMPITPTRIFFEETCLASRPAMPFDILKRRLQRRLDTLGVTVKEQFEEEWSYIPVGGALPNTKQQRLGFGAAASMIHPATGYSISRTLAEAPMYAATIAASLRESESESGSGQGQRLLDDATAARTRAHSAALQSWSVLWSRERRRQRLFMVFGLELLLELDVDDVRDFFDSFFRLPERYWKGFLSQRLSSLDLIAFALWMFVVAPTSMRIRLLSHLATNPSGSQLIRGYLGIDE